jgi:hypothetical protein
MFAIHKPVDRAEAIELLDCGSDLYLEHLRQIINIAGWPWKAATRANIRLLLRLVIERV